MLSALFGLLGAILFALLPLDSLLNLLKALNVILLGLEKAFSFLVLLRLFNLSSVLGFDGGKLLGATKHDASGKLGARALHSRQASLFGAFSLPLGTVLRSLGDLLIGVVLFIVHGSALVRLFDERDAFFALGALQVIHSLGQARELALLLLASLDLLLNGALHDGTLVENHTLFNLDRSLLTSALGLFGEQFESLLLLLFFHFSSDARLLASAALLFKSLRLVLFVLALSSDAARFFFLFTLRSGTFSLFLASFNDNLASQGALVLSLNGGAQFGAQRASAGARRNLGSNLVHTLLQESGSARQVVLDEARLEAITNKLHRARFVVDADRDVVAANRLHEDALHLVVRHKRNRLGQGINLHRFEHLGLLVHHANDTEGSESRQEGVEVKGRNRGGFADFNRRTLERVEQDVGALAKVKRRKARLHERVQLSHIVVNLLEQATALDFSRQKFARQHFADVARTFDLVAEQARHARVALVRVIHRQLAQHRLFDIRSDAHARQDNTRGERTLIFRRQVAVVHFTDGVELHPRVRVVKVILANPENFRQLGKVQRHHLRLGRASEHEHQTVNVFDGTESLLPHLERGGCFELFKAHLHVEVLRLWKTQIRSIAHILVLDHVVQVRAEQVAHASKLSRTLVLEAKLESLLGNHGVKSLELVVVAQDIHQVSVRFPQKLEPRRHGFLLRRLSVGIDAVRLHHERFRGKLSLEINLGVERAAKLFLRRLSLFRRQLEKPLDHLFEGLNIHQQARVTVLHDAILTQSRLFKLNTKLDVLEHHLFERFSPLSVASARDDLVQRLQRRLLLPDVDQLLLK